MSSHGPTKRYPGAQPGNFNALKHGLRSPRLHQLEAGNPLKVQYLDVSDEIEMLRKSIRHAFELSETVHSLREVLTYLRVLAHASVALSRLVRAHKSIVGPEGETASDNSASSEVSAKYDPTIEWAKCDPPEELLDQYVRKFNPAEFGEEADNDEESEDE